MLTFGEKVSRLEEAIVELLFAGMPYVRVVATYNGELGDRPKLVEALKTLKGDYPLVFVGYTGGTNEPVGRPPSGNAPLELRHTGTIELVACADDSRAQYKRVRGADALTRHGGMALTHRMFSDSLDLLSNRQLTTRVEDDDLLLNEGELIPADVDYIERVTGLTAVSITFDFSFAFCTADHSTPPSGEINLINFGVGPLGGGQQLRHPPGVFAQE
jgi:phage gp37-like protein